ncbi:TPA: AAA family ATPase [Candidatus Woesearchaeota archaeon]|nr:AAA family ATPase [Candidatus Woesearchaeota archaeon]HIH13304.1 AAA family ATPase [Candidatus Woesearchaeota archaeon]
MKKRLIIITGTPGTGKSTLAKILAKKLQLSRLDLHRYYPKISIKYETTKKCYTIDYPKFKKLVLQKLTQSKIGLIIDSHIAHHLPKAMVDRCIVLTCSNLKELQKRLAKRKYSLRKIRENIDAEIFQVCLMEAKEKGHKILHQDTSATTKKKLLLEILKKI